MKKSKDLRIIKTDENIRNTFLSILKEKFLWRNYSYRIMWESSN